MDEIEQEIRRQRLVEDQFVASKCAMLCNRAALSKDEGVSKIEAFVVNNNLKHIQKEQLGAFELYLNNMAKKAYESPSPVKSALGKRSAPPTIKDSKLTNRSRPTPSSAGSSGSAAETETIDTLGNTARSLETSFSQVTGVSYDQRTGSGQVLTTFNPSLGVRPLVQPSTRKPYGQRCEVQATETERTVNVQQPYRFMYTSLEERAQALERHLLHLQQAMCTHFQIDEDSLHPVGMPSQDVVWVCGRICCDSADGKLNKASLLLEGSRSLSGGRRVALTLRDEQIVTSLFPGQIVLVQGVNSSGRSMTAHLIHTGVPTTSSSSSSGPVHSERQIQTFRTSPLYQNQQGLRVFVAAGPFTTSEDLSYAPLTDLLGKIMAEAPDVVILLGPFVDVTQPLLASGDMTMTVEDKDENVTTTAATYELIFVTKVLRDCLSAYFNTVDPSTSEDADLMQHQQQQSGESVLNRSTQFVLIPSLHDAHHEYVFPQPPFGDRPSLHASFFQQALGATQIPYLEEGRVHVMSNPCSFRINEHVFSACSNDVLFALSSEEVSQNMPGPRLLQLAGHVLLQQSFCPQFPLPPSVHGQVDFRQSKQWELATRPDVLILPSRLSPLAKDIHDTLVVNPGHLTKGRSGGTYADLTLHTASGLLAGEDKATQRCMVQIVKI